MTSMSSTLRTFMYFQLVVVKGYDWSEKLPLSVLQDAALAWSRLALRGALNAP